VVDPKDSRIEQYSGDSDSWFLVYCGCQACRCPNKQTKVRERSADGLVFYWCTFCFKNHRGQAPKASSPKEETARFELPQEEES
jgi:hypothetical protein